MTDLFGQPEKPDTRYAEGTRDDRPEPVRPWSAQEDLALWTAWVSCNSTLAEQRVADLFCEVLQRPAVLPGTPTTAQLAQERLSLIRRRTVHSPESILGGGRIAVLQLADVVCGTRRFKAPLTWVEWYVFQRHQQLTKATKPRVSRPILLQLLERPQWDPELRATLPDPYSTEGSPAAFGNAGHLTVALLEFLAVSLDDVEGLKLTWDKYHRVLRT